MRYDWFIADNAEHPHTGVMDTQTDTVVETIALADDPEGEKAEALASRMEQQS